MVIQICQSRKRSSFFLPHSSQSDSSDLGRLQEATKQPEAFDTEEQPKSILDNVITCQEIGNEAQAERTPEGLPDQELRAQQSLSTLKQFSIAYQSLHSSLAVSYDDLPRSLWTFPLPSDISMSEKQLINTMRFVLTDFSSKCNRPTEFVSGSERTF